MSKIVWDKSGERLYETGVNHGVLYPMTSSGTYGTGVAWNGLTSVSESPDGAEANDLWADNIKYATLRSTETFGFTIEAYMYPDEFALCDGTASPVDGVYLGQQSRKPFGFVYRTEVGNDTSTEEDDSYKLHIVYNATASPSDKDYETINDSPDAITFSWECDTTPVNVTGYKPVSTIVIDSSKFKESAAAEKLALLESKLFGTDGQGSGTGTDPMLPDPDTVIGILNGTITT